MNIKMGKAGCMRSSVSHVSFLNRRKIDESRRHPLEPPLIPFIALFMRHHTDTFGAPFPAHPVEATKIEGPMEDAKAWPW